MGWAAIALLYESGLIMLAAATAGRVCDDRSEINSRSLKAFFLDTVVTDKVRIGFFDDSDANNARCR